ncbi:transposase IS66 family protein [Escherichia coli DEC10E]|nr:transposase IS66 family protein [Escherichia coli DEC10E]
MLTGKYCEHLPLYRQSEIFARQGVELSRALLSNWVDACCQLMTPLNDALYRYVMNTRKLHTDDTPVKVLAPGLKKTKTGRILTYVRMIAMRVRHLLRRSGSRTHRTGRGNTRSNTSAPSGVSCRRMRSQVMTGCSVQNVKVVR